MDADKFDTLLAPGADLSGHADVMLHHLNGAMDAGHSGRGMLEHLVEALPHQTIATFNSDKLVDFRSHRPWLSFSDWKFTEVEMPEIRLDLLSDDNDRNFLVLHGPEPDAQWNLFLDTIQEIVRCLGVRQTVGVTGMPAGVPHTRPTPVHMHGARSESLPKQPKMVGEMLLPAGMDQLIEFTLGQAGLDAVGIIAAVPYYLAEGDYPPAAAALMSAVAAKTGLALPVGDIEAASTLTLGQINQMVEQSEEAEHIVEILEQHFDEAEPMAIIETPEEPLPTAEELGARLEEFLKRTDRLNRGAKLSNLDEELPPVGDASGISSLRDTPYEKRNIEQFRPRRGRHRRDTPED